LSADPQSPWVAPSSVLCLRMAYSSLMCLWLLSLRAVAVQLRLESSGNASAWSRIWHCEGNSSVNRQDFTNEVIRDMATRATSIKICTAGSSADCMQSLAGTFPIKMLALGWAISHNNGVECDKTCAAATWFGPRLTSMWSMCPPDPNNGQSYYWACNNRGGLHFMPWDNAQCSWQLGYGVQSNLEAYIDAVPPAPTPVPTSPTRTPTKTPTLSPTDAPTRSPSSSPTYSPTQLPTSIPTSTPTQSPTGVAVSAAPSVTCSSGGDPHTLMFANTHSNFQGVGEYVLAASSACGSFRVNTCQQTLPADYGHAGMSSNVMVAIQSNGCTVLCQYGLPCKNLSVCSPSSGVTWTWGNPATVRLTSGVVVTVQRYPMGSSWGMTVGVSIPLNGQNCSNMSGLCGRYSPNLGFRDAYTNSKGVSLPYPSGGLQMYPDDPTYAAFAANFANTWHPVAQDAMFGGAYPCPDETDPKPTPPVCPPGFADQAILACQKVTCAYAECLKDCMSTCSVSPWIYSLQAACNMTSSNPTPAPTSSPTLYPTSAPTMSPTGVPTQSPTATPTAAPTSFPTSSPTQSPTLSPTIYPSASPTNIPTLTPTVSPTIYPTMSPTGIPTTAPTSPPTVMPTAGPPLAPPTPLPTSPFPDLPIPNCTKGPITDPCFNMTLPKPGAPDAFCSTIKPAAAGKLPDWGLGFDVSKYANWIKCSASVTTKYGTCRDYCHGQAKECIMGYDNDHHDEQGEGSSCTIVPPNDTITVHNQSRVGNGCLQIWKTQICQCGAPPLCPR